MSNRPVRGGVAPKGGVGGWVPGHNMPPLGFGVVPQQPGGMTAAPQLPAHTPITHPGTHMNWHHQQFVASQQMGMAGGSVGVQPMSRQQQQQPPQHFQQYPQHLQHPQQIQQQQQQWMEAQMKAAGEQKKLYDQMMKQRQFDEQKMRLKDFNASRKGGVSADSMIEHILGSKETTKPRSPHPPKKYVGGESESQQVGPQHRQGGAVDWTRMDHMNQLFTQGMTTLPTGGMIPQPNPDMPQQSAHTPASPTDPPPPRLPTGQDAAGLGSVGSSPHDKMDNKQPIVIPDWLSEPSCQPEVYQRVVSLVAGQEGWVDTSRAHMLLLRTGLPPPFLGLLWEMANCTRPGQLTQQEFTALLALVALVQAGQAVSGREVLSGVKEPLLPIIDHPALFPLVQEYIKQRQQQQASSQSQQEGSQSTSGAPEPSQQLPHLAGASQFISQQHSHSSGGKSDDEFDDFVSSVGRPGAESTPVIGVQMPTPTQGLGFLPQPPLLTPPSLSLPPSQLRPVLPAVDKMKTMNLPKVGFSPEMSPTTSFDHTGDDDFDDFQSAGTASGSFTGFASGTEQNAALSETSLPTAVPLQPERSGDKYAVFRELEAPSEELSTLSLGQLTNSDTGSTNDVDESFGDFCSSETAGATNRSNSSSCTIPSSSATVPPSSSSFPPILAQPTTGSGTNNTSPISFEIYSTPPEALPESNTDGYFEADFGSAFEATAEKSPSNYADIHEAMKRAEQEQKQKTESEWSDPFGEFEEAPSTGMSSTNTTTTSLPPNSLRVPQLNVDAGNAVDDDFGDFMGPGGGELESRGFMAGHHQPLGLSETLAETQSVASLELPGLEVTVGVECRGVGSGQSPDLTIPPPSSRNEFGVEEQLRSLSLDTSLGGSVGVKGGGVGGQQQPPPQPPTPVFDTFSGGLVDKYSSIRDEASKGSSQHDEAHTGSWERCLAGCTGLLQTAGDTLSMLDQTPDLKSQVLATSQMLDYLQDVREVWLVCERITSSSQNITTSTKVDQLLADAQCLWEQILAASDTTLATTDREEGERSQLGEGEVCGVCLGGGEAGGGRLMYGGHCYHPPCANLWLNCVDLLLPSLTPVTLL